MDKMFESLRYRFPMNWRAVVTPTLDGDIFTQEFEGNITGHKHNGDHYFLEVIDQNNEVFDVDLDQVKLTRPRPLYMIASEIKCLWAKPYFGAVPYLEAMQQLSDIKSNYGWDSADSVVRYFLGNATTWKGADARRIKAELKALLKK